MCQQGTPPERLQSIRLDQAGRHNLSLWARRRYGLASPRNEQGRWCEVVRRSRRSGPTALHDEVIAIAPSMV